MPPERIDIVVPDSVLDENDAKRERLARARRLLPTDRVPVKANFNQWGLLTARGRTPADYLAGPVENLREQILNEKWAFENLRDDTPLPTGGLSVTPDLGCLRGVEFPMEVRWLDDGPPKCAHPLTSPEQIDALEVPPPDGGLVATYIQWWRAMCDAAGDLDLRLNGQRIEVRPTLTRPGGPIPSAFALAGENLLLWMLAEPERAHRLMQIVTESHIRCIRYLDELTGRDPVHAQGMGCDAGEMLSPALYRAFVVPYYDQVWQAYPGPRGLHMCGRIDHLLLILRDELRIDALDGFGFPTDRNRMADAWAGRVATAGGPDPSLIRDGPIEAIVAECMSYIRTVGRCGGFTLSIGGGAAVGTPPEHIEAMVEASCRAGPVQPVTHTCRAGETP
ncbi:MAG: hypothetical protein BIFFINMI_04403 [Phycisphaerae bacterium]|nr:hypothetical protein [Phycisphaerae bacterium]